MVFALLLSGLPLRDASARASASRTKQNATSQAGTSSAQAKSSAAKARKSSTPTRNAKVSSNRSSATATRATPKKSQKNTGSAVVRASGSHSKSRKNKYSRRYSLSAPRSPYKSAVIYNVATGQVVFSRDPNRQVPPASLTKILSMFVAEDAIRARRINPNTLVTVSPRAAAAGGSRMGLSPRDKVPLEDLLHGMAVSSGNDASIAVAEFIGGSEKNFVQMMNRKARSIGMSRSTFVNANGLPAPGQYTTAKDMLTLARAYLVAYPGNLQKHHSQSFNSYKGNMTANANPLLRSFYGADGLKTGYVTAAGYNLIATAQRNGQRVIGVILGAPSSSVRANEACSLMGACYSDPTTLTAQSSPADLAAVTGKTTTLAQNDKTAPRQTAKAGSPSLASQDSKRYSAKTPKATAGSKKSKRAAAASSKKTADKTVRAQKIS